MRFDAEKKEIKTLRSLINLQGKAILEVGCGDGRITEMLVRKDNLILAIEPDSDSLKFARQRGLPAKFQKNTLSNLKTNKKFDLVIFSMSFHHVPYRSKKVVIEKARSLLNDGGEIWLIEPDLDGAVTQVVCAIDPVEVKRLKDAQQVLKSCAKKVKTISLNWQYDDQAELVEFFNKIGLINHKTLDKIKKILQIKDENKSLIIKDKISYYLVK